MHAVLHGLPRVYVYIDDILIAVVDGLKGFPEAINTLEQYREFSAAVDVPILANITEFGHTPLFTTPELGEAGVDIVLYCCSAYRAMNKAALGVYQGLLRDGHQRDLIDQMQTREELYAFLGYHDYERKLDELFAQSEEK